MVATLRKNKLRYRVESRVYKDVFWFGGYFRNLVPEWSDWIEHGVYYDLECADRVMRILEAKKHLTRGKTEYQIMRIGDWELEENEEITLGI